MGSNGEPLLSLIDRLVDGPRSLCKQAYFSDPQIIQVIDMIRLIRSDKIDLDPKGEM